MEEDDLCFVIKEVDMSADVKLFTLDVAKYVFKLAVKDEDFAYYLQSLFNRKFGPMWNCIAGSHFAATVCYENRRYIYFYIGQLGVILFQKGTVIHDIFVYKMWFSHILEEEAKEQLTRNLKKKDAVSGDIIEKENSVCRLGDVRKMACRKKKPAEICLESIINNSQEGLKRKNKSSVISQLKSKL